MMTCTFFFRFLFVAISFWIFLSTVLGQLRNYDKIGQYRNMTDKTILDGMLDSERYDHRMRPEAHTVVNVSILILTLSSPDESSVTYEVGFVMIQRWYDPRLRFQVPKALIHHSRDTIYLNGLKHIDRVWIPDTYFIKHGEFKPATDHFDPVHITLKIFPNGTVLYTTRRNMILTCEGNLKIFPFDSPKCFFGIESLSHERDEIELQWDEAAPIGQSDSLKTINAYMIRNETNRCNRRHSWRREFSCLSVLLVFSRDLSFYLSTVFVPGMVLVTSSFISFWLDVNAVPARVMIAVTTMLNFCTTTNSFRSKLPVVSNINAMNLWDFVCMFFIYASMIEFIIVNYIYRKVNYRRDRRSMMRHSISSQGETNYSFRSKSIRRCPKSDLLDREERSQENCEQRMPLSKFPEDVGLRVSDRRAVPPAHYSPVNEHNRADSPSNNYHSNSTEDGLNLAQMKNVILDWIKRPYLINGEHYSSNVHLARSIDHISKTVFTLLFGLFSFFYFLTYAVIKPSQLEDWIEKEFEAAD